MIDHGRSDDADFGSDLAAVARIAGGFTRQKSASLPQYRSAPSGNAAGITTRNCSPLSAVVVTGVVYELVVAPAMATPSCCHWYANGALPVATTANVAVCPAATVWLAG
jgi:hypothetical protein